MQQRDSTIIHGLKFTRIADDLWQSEDGRIMLALDMRTPAYPWRTIADRYAYKSKWSTPTIAIRRTLEKMAYAAHKQSLLEG